MAVNWGNVIAAACLATYLVVVSVLLYATRHHTEQKHSSSRTIYAGNFVINYTDPTTDFVRIELDVDLIDIDRSDVVMFKVVTDAKSPQV